MEKILEIKDKETRGQFVKKLEGIFNNLLEGGKNPIEDSIRRNRAIYLHKLDHLLTEELLINEITLKKAFETVKKDHDLKMSNEECDECALLVTEEFKNFALGRGTLQKGRAA